MAKLHVGCGLRKIPGYINIDVRKEVNPDLCCEMYEISKYYAPKTVEVIYACHILEHFKPVEVQSVLKNWFQLLKPGGVLRLSVPDFEAICDYYKETKDLFSLSGLIYGGQHNPYDYHFIAFDFYRLKNALYDAGFYSINKYDWKKTDHFFIDDYSQAFLPHLNKGTGKLMSLNVEAIKPAYE